jgi:Tfp pilus assembly protein PilO
MNKLSKEKQQQLIAVAAAAVVVIGLLYFFVIRAQSKSRAAKMSEIGTFEKNVSDAEALKKRSPAILADLEASKKKLDEEEKNMASGDLYSWVILKVNDFIKSRAHKVEIPIFGREERTHIGIYGDFPYDAVKYSLKGTGYYHDLGKFLADFENAFPYARIQNLDLMPESGAGSGSENEKLAFKFELVVTLKPKETGK